MAIPVVSGSMNYKGATALVGGLLLLLLEGCEWPPPDIVRTPPDYCLSLQSYLEGAEGADGLKCLAIPGLLDTGFYGPAELPHAYTLDECFSEPAKDSRLVRTRKSLDSFDYQFNSTGKLSTDNEVQISGFPGASELLPKVQLSGSQERAVAATIRFREVRVIDIVNLPDKLRAERPESDRCFNRLCTDGFQFASTALVGKLEIILEASGGGKLSIGASTPRVFKVGATAMNDSSSRLRLVGKQDVTFAIRPIAASTVFTASECSLCGAIGEVECDRIPRCSPGLAPVNGVCEHCGDAGETVCLSGPECHHDLANLGGTCGECGEPQQPPCPGESCPRGHVVSPQSTCVPCGAFQQPICLQGESCQKNYLAVAGKCEPCGNLGQVSCTKGCEPGLTVGPAGTCVACGQVKQPICSTVPHCADGLRATESMCVSCGATGEPTCLADEPCQQGLENLSGVCHTVTRQKSPVAKASTRPGGGNDSDNTSVACPSHTPHLVSCDLVVTAKNRANAPVVTSNASTCRLRVSTDGAGLLDGGRRSEAYVVAVCRD